MEQEDGVYILKPPGINKHPPVSFSTLLAFYFLSVLTSERIMVVVNHAVNTIQSCRGIKCFSYLTYKTKHSITSYTVPPDAEEMSFRGYFSYTKLFLELLDLLRDFTKSPKQYKFKHIIRQYNDSWLLVIAIVQ